MTEQIKVAIAGINGKMGRASLKAVVDAPELAIHGAFGSENASYIGSDLATFLPSGNLLDKLSISVSKSIEDCLLSKPDVLLEFTRPDLAMEHAEYALSVGVRPLIGTSGLSDDDFNQLRVLAKDAGIGCMVVPNFSIGAVLMMEFANQAGKYFKNVEIVEMHGTRKLDAPSGTASYTASKLAQVGQVYNQKEVDERELLAGARGAVGPSGVRIHSLRLPGLISHQDVVFGAVGEMLTISHKSFSAECFEKGIVLALNSMVNREGLTVGLENLL